MPDPAARRPRRGEVWIVDFNPSRGAELYKSRPAIVVSSDHLGVLPTKLVVPLTGWKAIFEHNPWHVRVEPTTDNGLNQVDAADALQLVCVSTERMKRRLGRVSASVLEDVVAAVALVIEYA